MGLKNLTPKELKKAQRILKALEFYGVTEEDIPLIATIKDLKVIVEKLSKEVISLKNTSNMPLRHGSGGATNEQFEDFYPHGRPQK